MSRKPKPTHLRLLQGNPGKRPINPAEPKPQAAPDMEPPKYLSKIAKDEWRRRFPVLRAMRVLTLADLGLFEVWCSAYGDFVMAERALRRGLVKVNRRRELHRSPWLIIKSKAIEQMTRVGCEFGFTPSSRVRLQVEPEVPEDAFEKFLTGKPAV